MKSLQLGRQGARERKFIAVAACPIDAISLFFTLTANLGHPIAEHAEPFVDEARRERGARSHARADRDRSPQFDCLESDSTLRPHGR